MAGKTKIRAAAVQFGVVADVAANLQTCLRMIDEAAKHKPDVMVLPEFVNHIAWYRDAAHCYGVAVSLDDD
ncbi:MAG TPA: nitrilase-related carbon-nitrogen hydrolase, partial [Anaerolineales bacterium]|nr:nitrilase-related carbon-nitrogen hydrolase [Anaerolineales bacterium]